MTELCQSVELADDRHLDSASVIGLLCGGGMNEGAQQAVDRVVRLVQEAMGLGKLNGLRRSACCCRQAGRRDVA